MLPGIPINAFADPNPGSDKTQPTYQHPFPYWSHTCRVPCFCFRYAPLLITAHRVTRLILHIWSISYPIPDLFFSFSSHWSNSPQSRFSRLILSASSFSLSVTQISCHLLSSFRCFPFSWHISFKHDSAYLLQGDWICTKDYLSSPLSIAVESYLLAGLT